MPRLEAWNRYSADHPPVHLMVAAYLGVKPAAKPATNAAESQEDVLAFLASIPGMSLT